MYDGNELTTANVDRLTREQCRFLPYADRTAKVWEREKESKS